MKDNRGLLIGIGLVVIGLVSIIGSIWWTSGDSSTSLPTDGEIVIPLEVNPGEDASLGGSVGAGQSLQQPGSFTGQDEGASNLQGAATFSPEDLNNVEF